MGCSEPSSEVDDDVDDRNDVKMHVAVEDVEVIVGECP